ncbi:M1 family metallopeptidase [Niastella populi]|uniref:Peptidase n=1 Tax=Niastella populi TaxID=550983 RepID=A0A1V9EHL3_9BACT|nr:M1 family metallopeptidase [Niastella populi]OQP45627.1 peptidase [Niastella populi]
MSIRRFLILIALISFYGANAQVTLTMPRNIVGAYEKGTRTNSGQPGPKYWQNTGNYNIDINFNPETRLLTGKVDIEYVNNSPNTLQQIVFKLYPNLYKKGSVRLMPVKPADITEGVHISSFQYNNTTVDSSRLQINGTNMSVPVSSLAPGGTMRFSIQYAYTLNKTSHIRTGEIEPGADFVAYFFPRIAVYDDVDGWNMEPYTGPQEFYNDFGNFNVAVTVPVNFVVWATGDLTNCKDVLNETHCQRLQAAEKQDGVINIIDSADLLQKNITRQNAFNTWKFSANDVTDFAFAVSDHYMWKSTSVEVDPATKRRTRVDAVFNPAHKDYYEVVDFGRKTVWAMSYVFPRWPFPYPHVTIVDGLDQMEYPMMVNDNPLASRIETIELVDHEVFHMMFPFYMGTNETKYGWMDEGWATIGEWIISPVIDSSIVDDYGVGGYERLAGSENDSPVTTLSTQISGSNYFVNSYPKPALGYLYVKDMLGDSLFTRALHYYIQQWKGKHPIPFDFFNCMNTGSGKNLNWFWKRWFIDGGVPDLSIKKVVKAGTNYSVTVDCVGHKPVPVDLTVAYADGTKTTLHRSVAVWEKANTVTLTLPAKTSVKSISLGSTYVPDVNRKNNVWNNK